MLAPVKGKHYIALEGEEKTSFLNHGQFDRGLKNAKTLYLWTQKGAFLHAKSLNTDKAWEAYDRLIDNYFEKPKAKLRWAVFHKIMEKPRRAQGTFDRLRLSKVLLRYFWKSNKTI